VSRLMFQTAIRHPSPYRAATVCRFFALVLFLFAVGRPLNAEDEKAPHSPEQLRFSAEDVGVQRPIGIPQDVLAALREDKTVQNVLKSENITGASLPAEWFSASQVHLGDAVQKDIVVVGQPPISGGNVAIFWVFRLTVSGYELVLNVSSHDLIIRRTRWNGYKEIEAIGATGLTVSSVLYRFDGNQYRAHKQESSQVP